MLEDEHFLTSAITNIIEYSRKGPYEGTTSPEARKSLRRDETTAHTRSDHTRPDPKDSRRSWCPPNRARHQLGPDGLIWRWIWTSTRRSVVLSSVSRGTLESPCHWLWRLAWTVPGLSWQTFSHIANCAHIMQSWTDTTDSESVQARMSSSLGCCCLHLKLCWDAGAYRAYCCVLWKLAPHCEEVKPMGVVQGQWTVGESCCAAFGDFCIPYTQKVQFWAGVHIQ